MDRHAARTVALALLAVLALGVVAATIDSAVTGGGGGFGGGTSGATGLGPSDQDSVGLDDTQGGGQPFGSLCLPILTHPAVMLGLLALLAGLLAVVYYDTKSLLPVAAVAVTFGLPGYVFWMFLTVCGPVDFGGANLGPGGGNFSLPQGGGGIGGSGEGAVAPPTAMFGFLLVFVLLGAVALLFFSTGDDAAEERRTVEDEEADVDVRELGRAAGAAADRIEDDADVENEVYRAWAEMTGLLDISNPRTSTPGEFASAAVDAGMAREDVDELTHLFEEVRYGGESATVTREERAVTALRRIEAAYADADEAGGGDTAEGDEWGRDS
ncbi:DUF4129 domain-containing protein [Halogeometricum limi]|uniref:Protein-glutamine gamma-glutamyltransferase-like C-terminal domain-containing protein n=1 Tax=Halogeometricum limi TaxID=555875 RepID=A0A1I6G3H8_9EURY|nr:DUF4129 domain-containing protein [Halogeometricum limi]SFR36754.1 protein of unknown function [Halogeometricum limi]